MRPPLFLPFLKECKVIKNLFVANIKPDILSWNNLSIVILHQYDLLSCCMLTTYSTGPNSIFPSLIKKGMGRFVTGGELDPTCRPYYVGARCSTAETPPRRSRPPPTLGRWAHSGMTIGNPCSGSLWLHDMLPDCSLAFNGKPVGSDPWSFWSLIYNLIDFAYNCSCHGDNWK